MQARPVESLCPAARPLRGKVATPCFRREAAGLLACRAARLRSLPVPLRVPGQRVARRCSLQALLWDLGQQEEQPLYRAATPAGAMAEASRSSQASRLHSRLLLEACPWHQERHLQVSTSQAPANASLYLGANLQAMWELPQGAPGWPQAPSVWLLAPRRPETLAAYWFPLATHQPSRQPQEALASLQGAQTEVAEAALL